MEKINRNAREAKSLSLKTTTIEMVESYPNYSYGLDQPFSYKVDSMLNILNKMTQYSMSELRNYFTVEEAAALCDMGNGTTNTPDVEPGRCLYFGFIDACEYEGLDEKWGIDKYALMKKLENLTSFQAYLVQVLTAKFWESVNGTYTMKEIADLFLIDYKEEEEEKVTVERRELKGDLYLSYDLPTVKVPKSITVTEENVKNGKAVERAVGKYEFKYWTVLLVVKDEESDPKEECESFYCPVYIKDAVTNIQLTELKIYPSDTTEEAQAKVDEYMSRIADVYEVEM